jgi:hypothetical protein
MLMAILCVEKVKTGKKLASTSRLQDIPVVQEKLASHLPPTDEALVAGPASPPQHEMEMINPEPNVRYFLQYSVCILTISYIS